MAMEEAKEDLVLKALGTGYLKVPTDLKTLFRDEYSLTVKELPKPSAFYEVKEDENEIMLMYKFDKKKMEEKA